ncbi:MAG: hypothetical protein V9E88_05610 [Ferruginibacter sp.]
MKQFSLNACIRLLRVSIIILILALISMFLFSFTLHRVSNDFLKELGIAPNEAEQKITNSILGGYLDTYGVKNIKSIATGNRKKLVADLLVYTKQHVQSQAFVKQYKAMKESRKPQPAKIQTPDEMRRDMIEQYKKSIAETEASLKKADASMKPVFEKLLVDAGKQLKEVQDPNNKMIASYAKNYPDMLKMIDLQHQSKIEQWEKEFPDNHLLFVKERLEMFMKETKNIDFDAALQVKNGKKYFVNIEYERKSNYWKMAFRAGRDVVLTAREYVSDWISTIN